ncbi:hypothetical protein CF327_g7512 [Tilletia walkeri]|nr:hypothetical protein CF327_g7512 [Tilletia walkeri]
MEIGLPVPAHLFKTSTHSEGVEILSSMVRILSRSSLKKTIRTFLDKLRKGRRSEAAMSTSDRNGKRRASSDSWVSEEPIATRTRLQRAEEARRPSIQEASTEHNEEPVYDVFRLQDLPPELIKLVFEHALASFEESPPQIHWKQNHPAYNRRLSELNRLVRVSKSFYNFFVGQLYHTLLLPREFGYSFSANWDHASTPNLHSEDKSAALLAVQLETRPQLRSLVKKIHVDPVVRLRNKAAKDVVAYKKIIESCQSTMEDLAIAVNSCDGFLFRSASENFIDVHDQHLLLKDISRITFPSLRHLTLEIMDLEQLSWVRWKQLPHLRSVTFISDSIFTRLGQTNTPQRMTPWMRLGKSTLYHALSILPSTVETVTFGFATLSGRRKFPQQRSASRAFSPLCPGNDADYLAKSLHKDLQHLVDDQEKKGRKPSIVGQLRLIRLVWVHSPHSLEWCKSCLEHHQSEYHDLPKLRRMSSLEEHYAEHHDLPAGVAFRIEPAVETATSSSTAISNGPSGGPPFLSSTATWPKLEMYEVQTPPAWEPTSEDEIDMGKLEVLWKALLYNAEGDTLAENAGDEKEG